MPADEREPDETRREPERGTDGDLSVHGVRGEHRDERHERDDAGECCAPASEATEPSWRRQRGAR